MTTPAQTRRRALIALLDQYPIARELHLHEGRRQTSPRDEFADKIEALFAEESSLFRDVMTASAAYVTRFGGELTKQGTMAKMDEETIEFKEAAEDLAGHLYGARILSLEELRSVSPRYPYRKLAAGELVDLLVTIGGVASYSGLTWDDIEQAARETLDKLGKRTTDTHQWNEDTKTVERIGKVVKS